MTMAAPSLCPVAQIGHKSGQFRFMRELGNDQYLTAHWANAWATPPKAEEDGQNIEAVA